MKTAVTPPRSASALSTYRLNIAVVYEDGAPRQWADQAVAQAASPIGESHVHCECWEIAGRGRGDRAKTAQRAPTTRVSPPLSAS